MIVENGKKYNLMLTVTESCNLNCVYCYESIKSKKTMSIKTAIKYITKAFDLLNNSNTLIISFHGGEPLIAYDLIKEISEWIWSKKWPCKYLLFATTNATLLTNEMKQWFTINRNRILLGLSYDGTDAMQDINRSASSRLIDKDFFIKNWPRQSIKMTISKYTVNSIAKGIIYLHSYGFVVNANLAYGTNWNMEESFDVFFKQLKELADFYIYHPKIMPTSLLNLPLPAILIEKDGIHHCCGSGRNMCSISTDGQAYPCHMFMPSSLTKNANMSSIQFALESKQLLMQKCLHCYMEAICPTCYGISLIVNGDLSMRTKDYCKMMKIRALASSYMFGKMLSSATNNNEFIVFQGFNENKINEYKKAIYYLQTSLQNEDWLNDIVE